MNFNFIVKNILLIFFTALLATTINVPGDYPTIQGALDVAQDGDIVLVSSGTYTENLLMEKEVTLLSVDGAGSTIIDGSGQTQGVLMSSTITIRPESNSPTIPQNIEIDGFEIKGGKGNSMDRTVSTQYGSTVVTEKLGGGIMAFNTSPKINNNKIKGNGNTSTANGGGIIAIDSTEDWSFNDREYIINPELPPVTEDLDLSTNIFENNQAISGSSVFVKGFEEYTTYLSSSTLDYFSSDLQEVSEYWVTGESGEFNCEGCQGAEPTYGGELEDDWLGHIYVDGSNGSDETGNGSPAVPFATISYAIGAAYATEEEPVDIYVSAGTYFESIIMMDYINIIGEDAEFTILDGGGDVRVLTFDEVEGTSIQNLTIQGGYAPEGGGMLIASSDPLIENVIIKDNMADYEGGGVEMWSSDAIFRNVQIHNNESGYGAGISMWWSSPILNYVSITENIAVSDGAGMVIAEVSNPIMNNVTISNNTAGWTGGGIFIYAWSAPVLVNSIMWGNSPYEVFMWYDPMGYESGDESITISHSNIENGLNGIGYWGQQTVYWLEGNITQNPLFTNSNNDDYTLQENSPCIDAGTNSFEFWNTSFEIPGNMYVDGNGDGISAPDMGAFEYIPEGYVMNDINGDGLVNIQDVVLLVNIVLGSSEPIPSADINGDGAINVIDVVTLVTYILGN